VIVLETLDHILPGMDQEMAQAAFKIFKKQGLEFRLGTRVQSARVEGERCRVECEGAEPIDCDRVLVAVGRRANTDRLGLDELGVSRTERGEIEVGDDFRTNVEGVYAIGDCVRGPKLAHKASHEGIACVNAIAGQTGHVNYDAIPAVVYTHPEMASVGATEDELKESGREYRKGLFPLQASGRARTLGDTDGFIKVLADSETDRLLGVHILGARAGDLIAEAAAAMEFGASAEDLASLCHAHPTLAESIGEAALAAHHQAIHIPPPKKRS
jgi:dihydrolipoamide dehydrogenase